jgi:hypothetical protein
MRVVAAIKDFSLQRKRLLTDEEFRSVVSATLPGRAVGSGKSGKAAD